MVSGKQQVKNLHTWASTHSQSGGGGGGDHNDHDDNGDGGDDHGGQDDDDDHPYSQLSAQFCETLFWLQVRRMSELSTVSPQKSSGSSPHHNHH